MAEKEKTSKKRGRPSERDRFKAVLLKSHAPQLIINYIYPQTKNNPTNKYVVQITHPNYESDNKRILWEKTYSAKTPIAKLETEAKNRLKRLQSDTANKTWVSGMEEFDKTLPQKGDL